MMLQINEEALVSRILELACPSAATHEADLSLQAVVSNSILAATKTPIGPSESSLFELITSEGGDDERSSLQGGSSSCDTFDVKDLTGLRWRIDLTREEGRGAFATVFPAVRTDTAASPLSSQSSLTMYQSSNSASMGLRGGGGRSAEEEFVVKIIHIGKFVKSRFHAQSLVREVVIWQLASNAAEPHPNIVQLVSVGLHKAIPIAPAQAGERSLFLVLEKVSGGTVRNLVLREQSENRSTFERIRNVMLDVLAGLDYLHGKGIIHGDVKPANILCRRKAMSIPSAAATESFDFLLTDFGAAHFIDDAAMTKTAQQDCEDDQTTWPCGTAFFISPEQSCGQMRASNDIWSLGITLFSMLIGRFPFPAHLLPHVLVASYRAQCGLCNMPEAKMGQLWPDFRPVLVEPWLTSDETLPSKERREGVLAILEKCTARNPQHRPTAAEMMVVKRV